MAFKDQIDIKDFDYDVSTILAANADRTSNPWISRKLVCHVRPYTNKLRYEVLCGEKIIGSTDNFSSAVEWFNNAFEKV